MSQLEKTGVKNVLKHTLKKYKHSEYSDIHPNSGMKGRDTAYWFEGFPCMLSYGGLIVCGISYKITENKDSCTLDCIKGKNYKTLKYVIFL